MRHRVRVPKVYAPRSAAELHDLGSRLGGDVSLVFTKAKRDSSGKVIRQGFLDHVVLEFEDPPPLVAPPQVQPKLALTDDERKAVRTFARLAAQAWAGSASQPLVDAASHEPRKP